MRRAGMLLIGWVVASIGCGEHPTLGTPQPIAFPSSARLGDTIAIAIDSNVIDLFEVDLNDITTDTVEIEIHDETGMVPITPRAVVYGSTALRSAYSSARPGAWIAIVLFDLPTTLQYSSYTPAPARIVNVKHNGALLTGRLPTIQILGPGGAPHQFYPSDYFATGAFEKALEPDPALRVRAFNNQGAFAWTEPGGGLTPIGSIQLDLTYPSCVSAPDAAGGSEAIHSTVLVNDDAAGRAKILLVNPKGFTLSEPLTGDPHAGLGPILEVAFTKTCAFTPGEFGIEELLVTDTMGNVLIDERGLGDSDDHFELYALNAGS